MFTTGVRTASRWPLSLPLCARKLASEPVWDDRGMGGGGAGGAASRPCIVSLRRSPAPLAAGGGGAACGALAAGPGGGGGPAGAATPSAEERNRPPPVPGPSGRAEDRCPSTPPSVINVPLFVQSA